MGQYPKVRHLEFKPVSYQGEQQWHIQDSHQLSSGFVLPPPEAELVNQVSSLCDGTRSLSDLYRLINHQNQLSLPHGILEEIIAILDEYFLLDNQRYQEHMISIREKFRQAPFRPMSLADRVYPSDLDALKAQFNQYGAADSPESVDTWRDWSGRAVISPHIDYQRGGNIYSGVWSRSPEAVKSADLVLMFATDHKGGLGSLTLTKKRYETPYGLLPTDEGLVDKLAQAIGEEDAYALELNHRQEHSVELSAVWLHHVCQDNPPPMVPLLIGSFYHYLVHGGHPSTDPKMTRFLETLRQATAGKRVLCVASVDLAHVGPEFGDPYIMDDNKRERLIESDKRLMDAIRHGEADRFYDEIASIRDANKVCGFSPVYLMLKYLQAHSGPIKQGYEIGYQHCSADMADESLVSICGILLD